jgi:hypothetical protein
MQEKKENMRPKSLYIVCILFLAIAMGCGTQKNVTGEKPVKQDASKPNWVLQRPADQSYYIGIGSASKKTQPLDYQAIAKKTALSDLTTEIKVKVQGSTFLNSLESNNNFSEEFISTISTTTDEQLENFEVAGIWEDKNEFWIFYRLSKAEYMRQKMEKKNAAMSSAMDHYKRGLEAEKQNNLGIAVDQYFHGLFAMKEYWNEPNEMFTDNGKVMIDHELYGGIQRILTGIRLSSPTSKITLNSTNSYKQDVEAALTYNDKPVAGLDVLAAYPKTKYAKPQSLTSDQSGIVRVKVNNVGNTSKSKDLVITIDLESLLPDDLDRYTESGLVKGMKTNTLNIPIDFVTPSFFVESSETNLGQPLSTSNLASAMQSALVKRGMRLASTKSEANYTIQIDAKTTPGTQSQGFYVAFLDMTLSVTNTSNAEVAFKEDINALKGLQLDQNNAGLDAFKKAKERLEDQVIDRMLTTLF